MSLMFPILLCLFEREHRRDRTHTEHIERWAEFVKAHPRSIWFMEVGPLIDAQIIMANTFYERLAKVEGGIEKIRQLRNLDKIKKERV